MPPISVMLKPASSLCNLQCRYCFYHSLAGQRESYSHGKMSLGTAEEVIVKAFDYSRGADVYFAFQGGEPLLAGLNFFREFVEIAGRRNLYRSRICYSMQTNGILLDEDWCRFLKAHRFLVGLSLDGYPALHDRYRRDSAGEGTYGAVMKAAELMQRRGVDFNILTVVTAALAGEIVEIYRYFKEKNFRFLQFIPYLAPRGARGPDERTLSNELYAEYLIKLFKCYYEDYRQGNYTSIRQFDNYVQLSRGNPAEQCGMNGHCSVQFVVEGDGTVYPCDFYCTDDFALGNVGEHSFRELGSQGAARFVAGSLAVPRKCRSCSFFPLCRGGGCRRYRAAGDYCGAYREFFAYAAPYLNKMG